MVVVSSWEYFAIMVEGRWFMIMFWGVKTIVKGEEVDDIFGVCVETEVPTSLTSYTCVNRRQSTRPIKFGWIVGYTHYVQ